MRLGVFFLLSVLTLAFCVSGVRLIPFHPIDGLDFMNLVHSHWWCPESSIPYAKTGADCGDPLNRPMLYPPLLYWAFSWIRLVPPPFDRVLWIWRGLIVAFSIFSVVITLRSARESWKSLWILLPLFLCLPMGYALERANNDALILFVWGIGIWAFSSGRNGLAGFIWGTCAVLKIYPGIGLGLIGCSFLLGRDWKSFRSLFLSSVTTTVLTVLLLMKDHLNFLDFAIPALAKDGGISFTSHTLYTGVGGAIIRLSGSPLWILCFRNLLREKKTALVGAAALAASSFYPALANDYSLITAYPLMVLLGARAFRANASNLDRCIFLFTIFACLMNRKLYAFLGSSNGNTLVIVLWFFAFPVLLSSAIQKESSTK